MLTRPISLLAAASGPWLADALARLAEELGELSDADRLEVVAATARLDAWTASVRARAVAALVDSARSEVSAVSEGLAAPARSAAGFSHDFDDERLVQRRVGT